MQHRHDVVLIGPPLRRDVFKQALERIPVRLHEVDLHQARRSPALLLGAELTIFTWAPGTHSILEADAYAGAMGALHAWWGRDRAAVGPLVLSGLGPCPACLAQPRAARTGSNAALAAWTAATAALHSAAILVNGVSELVGASWTWRLDEPGLAPVTYVPRPGCAVAGCTATQPSEVAAAP